MKKISIFFLGLVAGLLVGWLTMWTTLPNMMITVYESKLSFDDTVDSLQAVATASGWQVPKVYNIQKSLHDSGAGDIGKLKVVSLCKPPYAYEILRLDANKSVSAMMPCRIGVYETSDGKAWVASTNLSLMAKMFGGKVGSALNEVASDEHELIKDIVIP